jgi:hypothetical protein
VVMGILLRWRSADQVIHRTLRAALPVSRVSRDVADWTLTFDASAAAAVGTTTAAAATAATASAAAAPAVVVGARGALFWGRVTNRGAEPLFGLAPEPFEPLPGLPGDLPLPLARGTPRRENRIGPGDRR